MRKAITINLNDNVGVCLTNVKKGDQLELNGKKYQMVTDVQSKHKFSLMEFAPGDIIRMYGVVVGEVTKPIPKAAAITTDNIRHKTTEYNPVSTNGYSWNQPDVAKWAGCTFNGYHRSDGQVGTMNYWLVFPLVFCENRNIEVLKSTFYKVLGYEKENKYVDFLREMTLDLSSEKVEKKLNDLPVNKDIFQNVDGIKFLTHQGGCGGTRQDSEILCKLFACYLNNPNVAGATVLSLGCQNAQIANLKESIKAVNPGFDKPLIILDQQAVGREDKLIETTISKTFLALVEIDKIERKPAPLNKLSIGLECGGSDGFSGISANPTLGRVSDLISTLGGKALLSEFPELCGVEQELINRMSDPVKAKKFSHLMHTYSESAERVGSGFDMNPSPGNIKDGLITDAIKSAGAAKKGGNSPVNDVLDYAEYVKEDGLSLLCTPGNDVESTTGLAGSGANIILFTTGLGTPTGNPICPVIKVATNSELAKKMDDIIDIDTGPIIHGKKTIDEMGDEMLELIIDVASGKKRAKAVELQQEDFIPWKRGVSL